jgi:hypothetical protein
VLFFYFIEFSTIVVILVFELPVNISVLTKMASQKNTLNHGTERIFRIKDSWEYNLYLLNRPKTITLPDCLNYNPKIDGREGS